MVVILDYNAGNIASLRAALAPLDAEVLLSHQKEDILSAELLIIPGVGAFGDAMARLYTLDLIPSILERHKMGKPILGICLGMQLMFESSTELGTHKGLGLLSGMIEKIQPLQPQFKVPHMGWNTLESATEHCPNYLNAHVQQDVYFVHSYYLKDCPPQIVMLNSHHGVFIPAVIDNLTCKNNCGRLIGFQFHPEKSGPLGQKMLLNAIEEAINDAHSRP